MSRSPPRVAVLALALVAGWAAGTSVAETPPPQRVVSLNLCTDQLLMALLPPSRIASITWLSRSEGDPSLLPLAQRLPVNHGRAEEVLAARPDLVLAGAFTTTLTRQLLERSGQRVVVVQPVHDWDGIRAQTRELAQLLGEPARGEQLLAAMDRDLARLAARRPVQAWRVLGWSGNGMDIPGRDSLFDTLVRSAGADNVGAAVAGQVAFDLERLLQLQPQVLMHGAAYAGLPAWRNEALRHRALRARFAGAQLAYPEALYSCGVPASARAALQLQDQLLAWQERQR